jgi:hypothetical protein
MAVLVRYVLVGRVKAVMARLGEVRLGVAVTVGLGLARQGKAVLVRYGAARHGPVGNGEAVMVGCDRLRLGGSRQGSAWYGWAVKAR